MFVYDADNCIYVYCTVYISLRLIACFVANTSYFCYISNSKVLKNCFLNLVFTSISLMRMKVFVTLVLFRRLFITTCWPETVCFVVTANKSYSYKFIFPFLLKNNCYYNRSPMRQWYLVYISFKPSLPSTKIITYCRHYHWVAFCISEGIFLTSAQTSSNVQDVHDTKHQFQFHSEMYVNYLMWMQLSHPADIGHCFMRYYTVGQQGFAKSSLLICINY